LQDQNPRKRLLLHLHTYNSWNVNSLLYSFKGVNSAISGLTQSPEFLAQEKYDFLATAISPVLEVI
jgi:hypothetical protein